VVEDFRDLLAELRRAEARFLVVGAHALAAHGVPRATVDLDVWIDASPQFGLPPWRIDILTGISGVTFDEAWPERIEADSGDVSVPFIGRAAFVRNKRATGRLKDLADIESLDGA
jgi:hypothetical protein